MSPRKKRPKPQKPDEVLTFGPFYAARHGKYISYGSQEGLDPKDFKDWQKSILDNLPEQKKNIDSCISKLQSIIKRYSPLNVLSYTSTHSYLENPEIDSIAGTKPRPEKGENEKTDKKTPPPIAPHVEYLASLILATPPSDKYESPTQDTYREAEGLLQELFNTASWYYSFAGFSESDKKKHEARYHAILEKLIIRGDTFDKIFLDRMKNLFAPHSDCLKKVVGHSTEDIIACFELVRKEIDDNIHTFLDETKSLMTELHQGFLDRLDSSREYTDTEAEEIATKYQEEEAVKARAREWADRMTHMGGKDLYELKKAPKNYSDLLSRISLALGKNVPFGARDIDKYWPLNSTLLYSKPVIECEGHFYCFLPNLLIHHGIAIFEELIRSCGETEYKKYESLRSKYFEDRAVQFLAKTLGSQESYSNLFFDTSDSATGELDGLIVSDQDLFLIEVKSGKVTEPAKRGGISRIKKHLEELIEEPFKQALSARKHLESSPKPTFKDSQGKAVLELSPRSNYKDIYSVVVTAENLGGFATYTRMTEGLGVMKGVNDWPWALCLDDLQVISEIIDSPCEFIHFLKQRLTAVKHKQLHITDELDFLGLYIHKGLNFEGSPLLEGDLVNFSGYTDSLNRYYWGLQGAMEPQDKPRQKMPALLRDIIASLESNREKGFTTAGYMLLNTSVKARRDMCDKVQQCLDVAKEQNRISEVSLYFGEVSRGITIAVHPGKEIHPSRKMFLFSKMKKYQFKYSNWLLLNLSQSGQTSFELDQSPWKFNPKMEEAIKLYKSFKLESAKGSQAKLGRNDPCPCNSGKKFKRCCGQ